MKTKQIQVRGHGRRRPRVDSDTNWQAIAALTYLDGMTPEEQLDFTWAHPEVSRY